MFRAVHPPHICRFSRSRTLQHILRSSSCLVTSSKTASSLHSSSSSRRKPFLQTNSYAMPTTTRLIRTLALTTALSWTSQSFVTTAAFATPAAHSLSSRRSRSLATPPPSSSQRSSRSHLHSSSQMDQSFPTWSFDGPCPTMEWTPVANVDVSVSKDQSSLDDNADLVLVGLYAPPKDDDSEEEEEDNDNDPTVVLEPSYAKDIDARLDGALTDVLTETTRTFQLGAKVGGVTPTLRHSQRRYVGLGLGRADESMSGFTLGKAIAAQCRSEGKAVVAHVLLPSSLVSNRTWVQDVSTALYQEWHVDNRYRTGKNVEPPMDLARLVLVAADGTDDNTDTTAATAAAVAYGKHLATGVALCRDIVNAPHNVLHSESLADTAVRIAAESDSLSCEILGKEECEARGMGAYLGVARGSETQPQFIHITYTPPSKRSDGKDLHKVGIVGKGLLFDTGGYNIKTAMMELMKFDCGGAAAVLGAARAIGALQPEGVEAHFVVAACENMINEKAMVASDILTASNGKTIEVLNTDAEGRLTLADALVFCDKELGCERIVELSTLTGACMVALGKEVCGVWTASDELADELKDVSRVTGDLSWRMPLQESYNEQLKSKIADLKNVGTRYGGSITAALFLQNFVSKKVPYAHIDIAGPVWSDETGATGFGAKMVAEWVTRQGQRSSKD